MSNSSRDLPVSTEQPRTLTRTAPALYYADSEPGGEATDAFGAITVSASGLALALAKVDEEGSGKDAAGAETPEPSVIPEPSASPVSRGGLDAAPTPTTTRHLTTLPRFDSKTRTIRGNARRKSRASRTSH